MRKANSVDFNKEDSSQLFARGTKLNTIQLPVSDRTKWGVRNIKLSCENHDAPVRPVTLNYAKDRTYKHSNQFRRKALILNMIDCQSSGVRSGLLKQIHETVEIPDFRRLLNKLITIKVNREDQRATDALVARLNINAIHDELNAYKEVLENFAEIPESASEAEFETSTAG